MLPCACCLEITGCWKLVSNTVMCLCFHLHPHQVCLHSNSHIPQVRGHTRGQACRFDCQQLTVCIPDSHTFTQLTCTGVTVLMSTALKYVLLHMLLAGKDCIKWLTLKGQYAWSCQNENPQKPHSNRQRTQEHRTSTKQGSSPWWRGQTKVKVSHTVEPTIMNKNSRAGVH